jgi:hypothetical protein
VEPQVRNLGHDPGVALAAERGRDDLRRLLADLAADRRLAPGEQPGHVRALRRPPLASLDDALDALEHVGGGAGAGERVEEARARAGVTGHAFLVHLHDQRVAVAVGVHPLHVLHVTGRLALLPWRLSRARPEVRQPRAERLGDGVAIHPRDHEDFTRLRLLHHGRQQPLRIELQLVRGHRRTSTPRSAR